MTVSAEEVRMFVAPQPFYVETAGMVGKERRLLVRDLRCGMWEKCLAMGVMSMVCEM